MGGLGFGSVRAWVSAWWRPGALVQAWVSDIELRTTHVYTGLGELKQLCVELNIMVEEAVLSGIIALADHDGGGDISYAEFARVPTGRASSS